MYSDHITEGNQNIFLLRINKKAEHSEQRNRNVELELRTPKSLIPPISPSASIVAPKTEPVADVKIEDKKKLDVVEEIPKQPTKEKKVKRKKKKK